MGLRRLAETSAEGAGKYGDRNWLGGIPSSGFLNRALAHLNLYLDGDRGEDHLSHAAWDLLAACHNEERRPDMHDIAGQGEGPAPHDGQVAHDDADCLPQVASVNPHGPKDPTPDLTAKGPSSSSPGVRVLEAIQGVRMLPDGRSVKDCRWEYRDGQSGRLTVWFAGRRFLMESHADGTFMVRDVTEGEATVSQNSGEIHDLLVRAAEWVVAREQALSLLSRIVEEKRLPGGEPVSVIGLFPDCARPSGIRCAIGRNNYRIEVTSHGGFLVEKSLDGILRSDEDTYRIESLLGRAASTPVRQSPSPSGREDPSLPGGIDWDRWCDLVMRVNNSSFRPWTEGRSGWAAMSPATKRTQVFGHGEANRIAAYRWVDGILGALAHHGHAAHDAPCPVREDDRDG